MKQAICDHCNQAFTLQPKAELSDTGETQYFVCPHCQHRYDVCLITPRGLELRAALRQLEQAAKVETPKLRRLRERKRMAYQREVRSLLSPRSHPA